MATDWFAQSVVHCNAGCSTFGGSRMLFQMEITCDMTYVHVYTYIHRRVLARR